MSKNHDIAKDPPESPADSGFKFPRRLLLIWLYMAFVYCLGVIGMQWAKHHPIVDDRPAIAQNNE